MDAELKDGMLMSTINVRRATALSRSGATETLAAAVPLAAYEEIDRAYVPQGPQGAQRVTEHVLVIDAADVAASALSPAVLFDTDRFWIEGHDPANGSFGKKGKVISYKDPSTQALSHYEVIL